MKRLAPLSLLAALLPGCTPPPPPLAVEVWGCFGPVLTEPERACLVEPGGLQVWVGVGGARAELQPAGPVEPTCGEVIVDDQGDATIFVVPACRGEGTLLVTAESGATWRMRLLDQAGGHPAAAWRAWYLDGQPDGPHQLADVTPDWEATRRLVAARLAANSASMSTNSPAFPAARDRATEATIALTEAPDARLAHLSTAASLATFLRQYYEEEGRPIPARLLAAASAPLSEVGTDPADARPRLLRAFTAGENARRWAMPERAASWFEEARDTGRRFPAAPRVDDAQEQLDLLRLESGDASGAAAAFCGRLEVLDAAGAAALDDPRHIDWTEAAQLCARAGRTAWVMADGRDPLDVARRGILDPGCTSDGEKTLCLRVAEGLLDRGLGAGDPEITRARVGEAERLLSALEPSMSVEGNTYVPERKAWALARARVARLRGDRAEALRMLAEVAPDGRGFQPTHLELGWQALVERALLAHAAGEDAAALQDLEAAEALFAELSLWNTPAMGLEGLQATWAPAVELQVELMLARGEVAAAWDTVRRARRAAVLPAWLARRRYQLGSDPTWTQLADGWRALRSERAQIAAEADTASLERARVLQEEEAETRRKGLRLLAGDPDAKVGEEWPLPPNEPGDLRLLWVQLSGGWVGFAQLGAEPPQAAVIAGGARPSDEAWLAPFDALVERAARVVALPYGAVRERDPGALTWRGGALGEQRPVVISLDLPPEPRGTSGEARAVLVADPTGVVADAGEAVDVVATWARAAGWAPELLRPGPDVAGALGSRLVGSQLFHFHGHATAGLRAGSAWAWLRAELLLAPGGGATGRNWSVADTLLLPGPGPRWVYLSACESAKGGQGPAEALGLAQAFLIAGAEYVLGTSTEVPQDAARDFSGKFYAAGGFGVATRVTELSFQRSYAMTAERDRFRLYVR